MAIPMITFVGRSGSGKTTLLVKLIAELSARGYRVATVKHHSHNEFGIDVPGKDSWRHAQAGSRQVVVASPGKMAMYRQVEHAPTLAEIAAMITGVDVVLIEGFKQAELPTLEVVRAANSLDLVGRPEWRFAVATDTPLPVLVPQFALDDVLGIADCIETRFLHAGGTTRTDGVGSGISYTQAWRSTLSRLEPLGVEVVDLAFAGGRVVARELYSLVDSPSLDVSAKDGYAIRSADVEAARPEAPARLALCGLSAAGEGWQGVLEPGCAVRILTGAPLPTGAQAVVSGEFATDDGQVVTVVADAAPGRNVLARGSDVATGQKIVEPGVVLGPTTAGLLAAAGVAQVPVYRRPRVAIVATGDEVVAPGHRLEPGKLYASNQVTLAEWCALYGLPVTTRIVPDQADAIRTALVEALAEHDAVLTSGGAWQGERDLVVRLLDELGWEKVYHRVRIGPGKAVGMGLLQGKVVFCLPGGPPSNHMAFLQLALPGLHRLEGRACPGLPRQLARLRRAVSGQKEWTQFVPGRLEWTGNELHFCPMRERSRLQEMADMAAILAIPEGVAQIAAGTLVQVQVLSAPDTRTCSPARGTGWLSPDW